MLITLKPEFNVNYRSGQLYFTGRDGDPIHEGITWFTYTGDYRAIPKFEQFSHVGICIGEGKGIEATPDLGVVYCNLNDRFNDKNCRIIFREPVKLDELGSDPLILEAESFKGSKYDLKLFLGFALVNSWLARKTLSDNVKSNVLDWFDAKGRVLCSEYVMRCLINGKYTDDTNTRITPRELFFHACLKELKMSLPGEYERLVLKRITA